MSAYPYSLLPPTATTAFADSSSPTVSPAGSTSADAAAAGTGERTLAGTAARARNHLIDLSSASSSSSSSSSTELEVPGYADADAEEHPVSSYASTSTSDSYDSSGESLDRIAIAPFSTSTSSASTRDAASGRAGSLSSSARRAAAGLPAGTNEKEDYYSTEAWEGYRPELIMYRKGSNNAAVSSRRSSRHASGTTTPVASEKLEREGVYFESHHYQTAASMSNLNRSTPSSSDSSASSTPKKRKVGWWSRRAESKRRSAPSSPSSGPLLPASSSSSPSSSSGAFSSARLGRRRSSCFALFTSALLRQPWVPTSPLTILFTLVLLGCFSATLTTLLTNILSTDKQPLPWRTFCQDQRPFPHALADSLAPVNVMVGIFSVDSAHERRNLIRSTFARHTLPLDPRTGRPGSNVQVRFILGRPKEKYARRVALEMETFNDVVVLDIAENMNRGKTHAYFKWANENATVPVYYRKQRGGDMGQEGEEGHGASTIGVGFRKVDYVVKADDDAFIILSELERHLRISPREKTYWGYLIRNLFMAGEAYALSSDLVQYIATHEPLLDYTDGAEDKRVAKWMRLHPEASSINWITERCWIYDHPKAGTTYSHGFLFPDHVESIRGEGRRGLSSAEIAARGGERSQSFSTVSTWKGEYVPPASGMSIEEEIESLVEGGGRWSSSEYLSRETDFVRFDTLVFQADDSRLVDARYRNLADLPTQESIGVTPGTPDRTIHLPNARTSTKFSKDFLRDPSDVDAVRLEKRSDDVSALSDEAAKVERRAIGYHNYVTPPPLGPDDQTEVNFVLPAAADPLSPSASSASSSSSAASPTQARVKAAYDDYDYEDSNNPTGHIRLPAQMFTLPPDASRLVSPPTLRYDPSTLSLRERRMLNRPHGGTVVVHFLKKNEWFLETALALLGRDQMWDSGIPAAPPASVIVPDSASSFSDASPELSRLPPWTGIGSVAAVDSLWGGARMFGSPIVRSNGYICEGRVADAALRREYVPNEPTNQLGRLGRRPIVAVAIPEGVEVDGAVDNRSDDLPAAIEAVVANAIVVVDSTEEESKAIDQLVSISAPVDVHHTASLPLDSDLSTDPSTLLSPAPSSEETVGDEESAIESYHFVASAPALLIQHAPLF